MRTGGAGATIPAACDGSSVLLLLKQVFRPVRPAVASRYTRLARTRHQVGASRVAVEIAVGQQSSAAGAFGACGAQINPIVTKVQFKLDRRVALHVGRNGRTNVAATNGGKHGH